MRGKKSRIQRARFEILAVFTLALLCSAGSASGEDEYYEDLGWYAGIAGSVAIPLGGTLDGVTDNSGGLALYGGYRIMEQVALESEIEWVSGFTNSSGVGIDNPIMVSAAAKTFAFTGRVQPWMLFGVGLITLFDNTTPTEVTRLGFMIRFGAGLDYHFNEKLAFTMGLNFVVPTTSGTDSYKFMTIRFGPTYTF